MKKLLLFLGLILITASAVFSQCQASYTYVVNGNTVDFINTSTTDSSTATTWVWSFGDGNNSGNNDPQHTYASPGTYYVCLFIVDFTLCPSNPTMQFCDSVTIGNPNPCQASYTYVTNGLTVNFTNTSSTDSATAQQFYYDFGDGQTSTSDDPQHTYSTPGTYYVCLLIVDFNCNPNPTMLYCDSVTVGSPAPCQASYSYTTNGLTVDFTNTSSTDSATAQQFYYDFGDGQTSTSDDPQHTYASPGTYYVCLLIVDINCNPNPTMLYCDSITVFAVGIEEQNELSNLLVYPNPVKDMFMVNFSSESSEELQFVFYDILGSEIQRERFNCLQGNNNFSINSSNWSSGVYFMRVLNSGGELKLRMKLIK